LISLVLNDFYLKAFVSRCAIQPLQQPQSGSLCTVIAGPADSDGRESKTSAAALVSKTVRLVT
jgi:hypothetical protein